MQLKLNEAKRTKEALTQEEYDGKFEFKGTYRKPSDSCPSTRRSRRQSIRTDRKHKKGSTSTHNSSESDQENPSLNLAMVASAKLLSKDIHAK